MNSKFLQNKKGILGSFISMFVATIAIVIILVGFVLVAGLVKKIDNVGGGVAVYDEKSVGIDNIFYYMDRYISLLNARFLLEKGSSLEEAFKESGYEK
ncbi:MAG: hypothetical protein ABIF18_02270 [archaeon]